VVRATGSVSTEYVLVKLLNVPNTCWEWDPVRHGYPWVPTDQAHGRPQQVGPAYQKTR
jgi:hypothetical protein